MCVAIVLQSGSMDYQVVPILVLAALIKIDKCFEFLNIVSSLAVTVKCLHQIMSLGGANRRVSVQQFMVTRELDELFLEAFVA